MTEPPRFGQDAPGTSKKRERAKKTQDSDSVMRLRIAKTGKKILEEAARALKEELPPRKRLPAKPPFPDVPLPSLVDGLGEDERFSIVELHDSAGRTIVCLPPDVALKQGFYPARVALILRTRHNTVILRKRSEKWLGQTGTWDFYTDFVFAGEARKDAAVRLLEANAKLRGLPLTRVQSRPQESNGNSSGNSEEKVPMLAQPFSLHKCEDDPLALYIAEVPSGLYPEEDAAQLLELDIDELAGLVRDTPELLSAEVIWAERNGLVFAVSK